MKYRTKVILCILVALLGIILMINHLFEKEEWLKIEKIMEGESYENQ